MISTSFDAINLNELMKNNKNANSSDEIDKLVEQMGSLNLTKSNRGKDLLINKNYTYKVDYHSTLTDKYTWRCNEEATRCYTLGKILPIFELNDQHDQSSKPAKIEIRKYINQIKMKAAKSDAAPRKIIQDPVNPKNNVMIMNLYV